MQTVPEGWTAEERDPVRSIVGSTFVSWKKELDNTARLFTIGVSLIGGNDWIASSGEVASDWNQYYYFDESANLLGMNYERALNEPIGGITQALAEVELDNITGRYTPRYMGGSSELFTAILPRRPIILNAGFNYEGEDQMVPQFVGVTNKAPEVSVRDREVRLQAADFIDFLQNRYVDKETMFTGLRTDQVIEQILGTLGFATSQYDLDTGINLINFGRFKVGQKFSNIINTLVQAEYGHFYQDEEGVLRFENRQHWDGSPHDTIQRVILTNQVLEAKMPSEDFIINVVEVKAEPRAKQPLQLVFTLEGSLEIGGGEDFELFVNFDDPMLSINNPVHVANSASDGSGTDKTAKVTLKSFDKFAEDAKIVFHNSDAGTVFVTALTIYGRPAKVAKDIYVRKEDDSSVTAYEERPYEIENDYIQSEDWADSFAQMILNDYAEMENLQELTIRAFPELQMGDLISWQGRYWRVFGIKTRVEKGVGLVQDLRMLQRTVKTYFRIGISSIGGVDQIAP